MKRFHQSTFGNHHAAGVRLMPWKGCELPIRASVAGKLSPFNRLITLTVMLLMTLNSSPSLLAMSAREAMGGSAAASGGRGGAANLQNAGAASAALTATRAREAIQRSEASISAMRVLQNSARAALGGGSSFNGFDVGGLRPRNGSTDSWSGATLTSGDSWKVNIRQTSQNAFLYWDSFNIGSKTKVNFDQSAGGQDAGKWIAFNKVMGTVSPSRIYGSITALGQIYILNQNGILFHNGSQVNTHSLVASALPINENLAGDSLRGINGRGIANNPDSQFLFSALTVPGNANKKTDTFVPSVTGAIGNVVVERGARITSPVNENHTGGMVALVGANVRNDGSISTPNGQTILAAGLQVALTPHNSADPSLRGMDVTIGRVSDPSGIVTALSGSAGSAANYGLISFSKGNATIAGKWVLQNGGMESSTSTELNGRIDLLASYNAVANPDFGIIGDPLIRDFTEENTGLVETGPGSVIRILPEWGSDKTITGSALALNSLVAVTGRNIHFGAGSILLAPGAVTTEGALAQSGSKLGSGVTVSAGNWIDKGGGVASLLPTGGSIHLDSGALIDVAGSTGVQVESSKYILKLQLRGSELADSPLQKNDKNIRGVDLIVDARISGTYNGRAWIGTPLGDATGYARLIPKTVSELTTAGGSVSMTAGDSVVMRGGSSVDVSGGWTRFSGGDFATSKLLYQGVTIDVSQATPDRVYTGVVNGGGTVETSTKWGIRREFGASPLDVSTTISEASYVSGSAGGSVAIQAPGVALDGVLHGNTVSGPRQLRDIYTYPGMKQAELSTLPDSSSLSLTLAGVTFLNGVYVPVSPYAPSVLFSRGNASPSAPSFRIDPATGDPYALPASRASSVILSPELTSRDGFGNLSVTSNDGSILLPAGMILDAGPNGSVTLKGANVSIGGSIKAPGGSVSLHAAVTPLFLAATILPIPMSESISGILVIKATGEKVIAVGALDGSSISVIHADGSEENLSADDVSPLKAGSVTLAKGASILVGGTRVDDTPSGSGNILTPVVADGGEVSIGGYRVSLSRGSLVDVSGGVLKTISGGTATASYGNAGSIAVTAGQDDTFQTIHRGQLALGADLLGYSGIGASGGSLSLGAPAFQIGGGAADPRVTVLGSAFFSQGGFSSFKLSGIGLETDDPEVPIPGVRVTGGTLVRPVVTSLLQGGDDIVLRVPPSPLRTAPSISLSASGLSDSQLADPLIIRGAVVVDRGASFVLEPQLIIRNGVASVRGGSLSIKGPTVNFSGAADVKGGSITLSGGSQYPSNDTQPSSPFATVALAPGARLSVAGTVLETVDPLGMRDRFGAVADGGTIGLSGNILAASGSVMDASGASAILDFLPYQLGMEPVSGSRSLISSGTVAYRVDSSGGGISLSGTESLLSDAALMARSGGPTATGGSLSVSSGRFGSTYPTDLNLSVIQSGRVIAADSPLGAGAEMFPAPGFDLGGGGIAVSSFSKGGFDNVSLAGNVFFSGGVSISVPGTLKIATGGILSADAPVVLSSTYAALGTPFSPPLAPNDPARLSVFDPATASLFAPPTWGTGRLTVHAGLIDVGNLSLAGIGDVLLDAGRGAIRGDGTFAMAGNLTLRSAMVYPVSGVSFNAIAYNYDDSTGTALSSEGTGGSVTVRGTGAMPLPLSAMGSLSFYAATITQGGTLAAPFGTITLGWSGSGASPLDPVGGAGVLASDGTPVNWDLPSVPVAETVTLARGSVTTVSAIDRITGRAITVPYGVSADGTSWTDPSGTPITGSGLSSKSVNLNAATLVTLKGSMIDLRGGGAVVASQWVAGTGGTIDWLSDSSGSWAIVPGYGLPYAPKGYGEGWIGAGSRVKIAGGGGLRAGVYTLLPASYATLPGSWLISPASVTQIANAGMVTGSVIQPDGSVVVSGTILNGLNAAVSASSLTRRFELDSPAIIASKAEYRVLNADAFFAALPLSARALDAASLGMQAGAAMILAGSVDGRGGAGGLGASIDITGSSAFRITGEPGAEADPGEILLNASVLSSFDAFSILIGGTRKKTPEGADIIPSATSIVVDSGTILNAPEVILAVSPKTYTVVNDIDGIPETIDTIAGNLGIDAGELRTLNALADDFEPPAGRILKLPGSTSSLSIGDGVIITGTGSSPATDYHVTGNGVLIRVGGSSGGTVSRGGFDANGTDLDGTPLATLSIGSGARLGGGLLIVDSTGNASIAPTASIRADSVSLSAGGIGLDGAADPLADPSMLILSGSILNGLSSSRSVDLTSYGVLSFRNGVSLGSSSLGALGLHGRVFSGDGSDASVTASTLLVDNAAGAVIPPDYSAPSPSGRLRISADKLVSGAGDVSIDGFSSVVADLSLGLLGKGKGSLSVSGDLAISTPVITGAGSSANSLSSEGSMNITSSGASASPMVPGLGSAWTLSGAALSLSAPVLLPSGRLVLSANSGDLVVTSLLNVSGAVRSFGGVSRFADAGSISLKSGMGNLVMTGSTLDLSANAGSGNAGHLLLSAPGGSITLGSIRNSAPAGSSGSVSADLATLPGGSFATLETPLAGFTKSQDFRIRTGNVTVGNVKADSFTLSADQGSIDVDGTIDASGVTGGRIALFAGGSLVIGPSSRLTVHGDTYDAAGKGGVINLEAGASSSAIIAGAGRPDPSLAFNPTVSVLDLQSGSILDLGVSGVAGTGQASGVLLLKAPQTADAVDLQINPVGAIISGASSIVAVGNNRIDAASEGAASIDQLTTWGNLPAGLSYLPGQQAIGGDGNVYKLTADPSLYAQYVSEEVAGGNGVDPSSSSYWTKTVSLWDETVALYSTGEKVLTADGLVYTATRDMNLWSDAASYVTGEQVVYDGKLYSALADYANPLDGSAESPDTSSLWTVVGDALPGTGSAWALRADDGNLKRLALENASSFTASASPLFAGSYASGIHLRPGEEIVNSLGGLVLNSDWDLSLARYGVAGTVLNASENPVMDASSTPVTIGMEAGLLTLRSSGDITLRGSISDGFGDSVHNAADVPAADGPSHGLYFAPLLPLLRDASGSVVRQGSWSYRLAAGGDFTAADPFKVMETQGGSLRVGVPGNPLTASGVGDSAQTQDMVNYSGQYQVIRTGTGDISLTSSGDVRLESPFASVYTAGARIIDPTLGGTFDLPQVYLQDQAQRGLGAPQQGSIGSYPAQYSSGGGNVTIRSGHDITRLNASLDADGNYQYDASGGLLLAADSSLQMPSDWLYRRGSVDPKTGLFERMAIRDQPNNDIASTTWWVDFSNFFQDIGALGGGNVSLDAAGDVANVSASIPTSFRMPGKNSLGSVIAPSLDGGIETGGGNLSIVAGNNIDAGVYYVERGVGSLKAGGSIITNPTRDPSVPAVTGQTPSDSAAWLPTSLFLGKGSFDVLASSDLRLGPVANVFLAPQGVNNSYWYKTYFSTYSASSSVNVRSLSGSVALAESGTTELSPYPQPLLQLWYGQQAGAQSDGLAGYYVPWIRSAERRVDSLSAQLSLSPPIMTATAFSGDITVQGNLTMAPAYRGDLSLMAAKGITGLASTGTYNGGTAWSSSTLNLSDADPAKIPGVSSPLSKRSTLAGALKSSGYENGSVDGANYFTDGLASLFAESGSFAGIHSFVENKQALHAAPLLHLGDTQPLRLVAAGGNLSGLTLFSAKRAEISASGDITDIGLYLQNNSSTDISVVSAGKSLNAYDAQSILRSYAVAVSQIVNNSQYAQDAFPSGDIQIAGPGTLEVLAGKGIDLGNAPGYAGDPTIWVGLTSIGNARNPSLPFQGADLVVGAGARLPLGLSSSGGLGLDAFVSAILSGPEADAYLSELVSAMAYAGNPLPGGLTASSFASGSTVLTPAQKALASLQLFYIVLRDTGRNFNRQDSPGYKSYASGEKAIATLFRSSGSGGLTTWSRDIRTKNGGNISIFTPGGGLTLANIDSGASLTPPGIVTEHGGGINIFARDNVDIGIGRIFTLRGGDITIWSDKGDIAAGNSAKTVASAPPTRVLIDPQSGDVVTDLAGLSTGGGIGVLATVEGIPPGSVDLIAPSGVIDAGDAGIRSSGNLNLAATRVLNADNIAARGTTAGAPPSAPPPAAPNVSGASAASSASAANNNTAQNAAKKNTTEAPEPPPSLFSIEVLGYGGEEDSKDEENKSASGNVGSPAQASL